jgi:hypothetical protein
MSNLLFNKPPATRLRLSRAVYGWHAHGACNRTVAVARAHAIVPRSMVE